MQNSLRLTTFSLLCDWLIDCHHKEKVSKASVLSSGNDKNFILDRKKCCGKIVIKSCVNLCGNYFFIMLAFGFMQSERENFKMFYSQSKINATLVLFTINGSSLPKICLSYFFYVQGATATLISLGVSQLSVCTIDPPENDLCSHHVHSR